MGHFAAKNPALLPKKRPEIGIRHMPNSLVKKGSGALLAIDAIYFLLQMTHLGHTPLPSMLVQFLFLRLIQV
jgi:hypothetical protein